METSALITVMNLIMRIIKSCILDLDENGGLDDAGEDDLGERMKEEERDDDLDFLVKRCKKRGWVVY